MAETKQAQTGNTITRVFEFRPEAVIPACPHCQAPGIYHSFKSDPSGGIFHKWPGCWVQMMDERQGHAVGDLCPNCGGVRSGPIPVDEWRATHPVD